MILDGGGNALAQTLNNVSIRKESGMTDDLDDLLCPHSAAGRPERLPAKAVREGGRVTAIFEEQL